MHRILLMTAGVILYCFFAGAQSYSENDFIQYTTKDGLSDNYVTTIQQDKHGFIWIGTDVGLNRYDGYNFNKYFQSSTQLPLLTSKVWRLKSFPPNYLGILGRSGFQLLNTTDYSVRNFIVEDSTRFSTYLNSTWDAIMFPDRSFGVTTRAGFYVFDKEAKLTFRKDAYSVKDVNKMSIRYGRDIYKAGPEDYLVYVERVGLVHFNPEKKTFTRIQPGEKWSYFLNPPDINHHWITKYQLNENEFMFINFETAKLVWYDHVKNDTVSSDLPFKSLNEINFESRITRVNDSVFLLNGSVAGFFRFTLNKTTKEASFDQVKYLPGIKINVFFVDREGRLWAGTPEGLLQQRFVRPFLNAYKYESPVPPKAVLDFSSAFRYGDKLYVGRFTGPHGLFIIDTGSMKVVKELVFSKEDRRKNEVFSIQMYHKDTLWVGTNRGIVWVDTKTHSFGDIPLKPQTTPYPTLQVMLNPVNAFGEAWFTYNMNGVAGYYSIKDRSFRYFTTTSNPALPFLQVKSTIYDSYGDVWIGGHALTRFNRNAGRFDTLMTSYGGNKKFNDDILTLTSDNHGSLWLHNDDNGLLEYRIKERKFVQYTSNEGLPFTEFDSFSPVLNDVLWIAGRSLLARFDIRTKTTVVFDAKDGLPLHRPTARRIYYDKAGGMLYLLCNNEIVKFPVNLRSTPPAISTLKIDEIIINNKQVLHNPDENFRLKYTQNNIDVHFSVVDFESGKNYVFAYKLDDDDSWNVLGHQRNIRFIGIRPGKHTLQVRMTDKDGKAGLSVFNFRVAFPFWQRTWFLISVIALLSAVFYFLYRRRISAIRQKANIDKQLAQTEMKALYAQMNPHFIFNCLNSIREMILNNENEQASLYLSRFARLIRITLDQSSKPFVSLESTVDYLHRYLEMEQIRKNTFSYNIAVEPDMSLEEILLPPMLIQPFIENAIWHGEVPGQHMHIDIRFLIRNTELVCIVEDDGVGINTSLKNRENTRTEKPVGVENIRQRIKLLNEKYDLKSSITIEDKSLQVPPGKGTIVTLHLPAKTKDSQWNA